MAQPRTPHTWPPLGYCTEVPGAYTIGVSCPPLLSARLDVSKVSCAASEEAKTESRDLASSPSCTQREGSHLTASQQLSPPPVRSPVHDTALPQSPLSLPTPVLFPHGTRTIQPGQCFPHTTAQAAYIGGLPWKFHSQAFRHCRQSRAHLVSPDA